MRQADSRPEAPPAQTLEERAVNDAYERRALLLQLGNVLEMLDYIKEHVHGDRTVGDLVSQYPALADVPLLTSVAQTMTVGELEYRTLYAFCRWPHVLLDTPLDRRALASPVRELLFDDNPCGWESYAEWLAADVPWFGSAADISALSSLSAQSAQSSLPLLS